MANPVLLGASNAPQAKSMMTALTGLVEDGGRVGQIHSDRKVFTPITASVKSSAPSTDYNGYFKVIKASPLNKELPENTSQKEPYIWVYNSNEPLPEDPHNLEGFYSGYVVTKQTLKIFSVPMTQLEVRTRSDEYVVLNVWVMGPIVVANITIGDYASTISRKGVVHKIILAQITNRQFLDNSDTVASYSITQLYTDNKNIEEDIYTGYYRISQVPVVGGERVKVDEKNFASQSWQWAIINGVYPEDFVIEAGLYYTSLGTSASIAEFKTAQVLLDFGTVDVDPETGESPFKGNGTVYVYLNIISPTYKSAKSAIILTMTRPSDNQLFWLYYRRIGSITFKDYVVTEVVQELTSNPTVIGHSVYDSYPFHTNRLVDYAEGTPGVPVYKLEVLGGRVDLGIHECIVDGKTYILTQPLVQESGYGKQSSYANPDNTDTGITINESSYIYMKIDVNEENFKGEIMVQPRTAEQPKSSLETEIVPLVYVTYDEKNQRYLISELYRDANYYYDLNQKRWG